MRSLGGIHLIRIINVIFSVIEFFIGLRLILRLFAANPASLFVSWINNISGTLLIPFFGMFPNIRFAFGVLDVNALIGLVVYAIIFSVILWIIRVLSAAPQGTVIEERHQVA